MASALKLLKTLLRKKRVLFQHHHFSWDGIGCVAASMTAEYAFLMRVLPTKQVLLDWIYHSRGLLVSS